MQNNYSILISLLKFNVLLRCLRCHMILQNISFFVFLIIISVKHWCCLIVLWKLVYFKCSKMTLKTILVEYKYSFLENKKDPKHLNDSIYWKMCGIIYTCHNWAKKAHFYVCPWNKTHSEQTVKLQKHTIKVINITQAICARNIKKWSYSGLITCLSHFRGSKCWCVCSDVVSFHWSILRSFIGSGQIKSHLWPWTTKPVLRVNF